MRIRVRVRVRKRIRIGLRIRKRKIEPAVTKELWRGGEDKKDKQYKGACSSTKKGGNKRYQMRKPRKR